CCRTNVSPVTKPNRGSPCANVIGANVNRNLTPPLPPSCCRTIWTPTHNALPLSPLHLSHRHCRNRRRRRVLLRRTTPLRTLQGLRGERAVRGRHQRRGSDDDRSKA